MRTNVNTCNLSQFEAEYIRLIGSFTCVICLILRQNTNNNQPLRVIKMQWLAHCIISCQRNLSQNAPNYTNVVMNKSIDNVYGKQPTSATNWQMKTTNNNQPLSGDWYDHMSSMMYLGNATLAGQNVIWQFLCWFTYTVLYIGIGT